MAKVADKIRGHGYYSWDFLGSCKLKAAALFIGLSEHGLGRVQAVRKLFVALREYMGVIKGVDKADFPGGAKRVQRSCSPSRRRYMSLTRLQVHILLNASLTSHHIPLTVLSPNPTPLTHFSHLQL